MIWRLDNIQRIGGHRVDVLGAPRCVATERGVAIWFDGQRDGLLVHANPVQGLDRFAIEIVFQPAADGAEEQRFLHIEEADSSNRALIELRMQASGRWSLDTYLHSGTTGLTLLDRTLTHAPGAWHTARLTFDGRVMAHDVDGVAECAGEIAFSPLGPGRTSIGVRQNRHSWFKGLIHSIVVTPGDLRADGD